MPHWKYRAFDENFNIEEGIIESSRFERLALKLRQNGLTILDAIEYDDKMMLAEKRLSILKKTASMQSTSDKKAVTISKRKRNVGDLIRSFVAKKLLSIVKWCNAPIDD